MMLPTWQDALAVDERRRIQVCRMLSADPVGIPGQTLMDLIAKLAELLDRAELEQSRLITEARAAQQRQEIAERNAEQYRNRLIAYGDPHP